MDVFALALWSLLTEYAVPVAAIFIAFLGVVASSAVAFLAYQTSKRATEIAKEGLEAANRESEGARRASLDARLSAVISAIPKRMQELTTHAVALERYQDEQFEGGDPDLEEPSVPPPYELHVLLESARMIAKSDVERRVLAALADCFYAILELQPMPHRARLSHLPEMIRQWRDGSWSDDIALTRFATFAQQAWDKTGVTVPPPFRHF